MKTFTLYTVNPSRGSMIRWMLEECGADYDTVALSLGADLKTPEYLAVNPMGKVPALQHKGETFTETAAILTYLAEQFPETHLIPEAGSVERGQYYRWLCFSLHLEYAAMDKWRGISNNDMQRQAIGYGDLDTALNTLRRHLQGREYMVGSRFSALDIYYSGLLEWLIAYAQIIPAEPAFTEYTSRHLARPAFARVQELEKQ